ncbi:MAG: hypothetical protein DMD81_27380 [Candidatus Rokuibacteriota bacterium]|nr:MAG: hypothetical protein DMD81_27380 [Candidatus Rokubacteria bacterium]
MRRAHLEGQVERGERVLGRVRRGAPMSDDREPGRVCHPPFLYRIGLRRHQKLSAAVRYSRFICPWGLGLTMLPAPTLVGEIRARTLVARRPIEGPFLRPIGALYRRTRELSAACQAFLALLTGELGEGATSRQARRPGVSARRDGSRSSAGTPETRR